jgi:O-acetyl-ADP-ribose deacetylase (regulator of RNase III)
MSRLNIVEGCLIKSLKKGEVDVILHVVNCQKTWGAGLAKNLKKEFPEAFESYMKCCSSVKVPVDLLGSVDFPLGNTLKPHGVVSLFAQERYGRDRRHLDYGALALSLSRLQGLLRSGDKVGVPHLMGCGLAGGNWEVVSELIEGLLAKQGVKVTVYKQG